MDSIVYCNFDQHKHESYILNLYSGNFRNDLDAAITNIGIKKIISIAAIYITISIMNGKILHFNFCPQLTISKPQLLSQICQHQTLFPIAIKISLFY